MTDCIFDKIINKEIPAHIVYEDDVVLAFLDISQVTPGHTLVVPKKHVANIFEYDEDLASAVFARIPKIARAVQASNPDIKGLNILSNNINTSYQHQIYKLLLPSLGQYNFAHYLYLNLQQVP